MDAWRIDARHGARALANARGFTAIAVLSLALGVGAATAIFSVGNAVILRPLPYPDAERIAIIWQRSPGLSVAQDWLSLGQYLDIAADNSTLTGVAAAIGASVNMTGDGAPERVDGIRVSSSFFPLFGARAAVGHVFTVDDDRPGKAPIAILNHGFWRRRFGGDRDVVGKTVTLNGVRVTIAGVMANEFSFTKDVMPAVNGIQRVDLLLPLPLAPSARANRSGEDYNVFAKLRPGVSFERAQAEMDRVAARMKQTYPASYPPNGGLTLSVVPLRDQVVGDVRLAFYVLVGAVGLMMLIACGNVANLLLARGAAREREMAVRAAVGANRARLLRQALVENAMLAAAGGMLGLAFAAAAILALRLAAPANLPRMDDVGVDWGVLLIAIGITSITALVFGLGPAVRASRVDPAAALKDGGRVGLARGRGSFGIRKTLISAEVAFALLLSIGASLLVRSYARIATANPGFDPHHVLSLRVSLPGSRYKSPDAVSQFFDQANRRIGALPGVQSVGSNYQLPLSSVALAWEPIAVEGYVPKAADAGTIIASSAYVSTDYFRVMGMPLVDGRAFTAQDDRHTPPVVIVNQSLAARFWPNESALGKRIRQGDDGPWRTVVGVVTDARAYEPAAQPPITAYFPVEQFNVGSRFIVVRTAAMADAASLAAPVTRALHALDPDLPAYDVSTMDQRLSDSLARRRLSTILLGVFAAIALVLAAVGIYGVVAQWVESRTREIGIRIALGADRGRVLTLVGRELAMIVGFGLVAGLAGAFVLTRLISGLLFGITPTDARTFSIVPCVLAGVAVAATLFPARRAMRVEPTIAMRHE